MVSFQKKMIVTVFVFTASLCASFAGAEELKLTPVIAEPVELKKTGGFELPPPVDAGDVAPKEFTQSANFKLSENVEIADFYFRFHLVSERFGEFTASSLDMLKVRAHELDVLAAADENKENGFTKGAAGKFVDTGKAAKDTIVTPVKTIEAVGHGISGYGQDAFDFIRRKDRKQPKDSFFLGDDERKIAAELTLDFYSTNPQVREMLSRKAKLRAVGSKLVGVSMSVGASFFFPVSIAVSTVRFRENMNDRIASSSAIELYRYNDGILKKMGVESFQREMFLQYAGMTPRQRTEALSDLKTLTQLSDKTAYLNTAVEAHPAEGVWQVQCADLLAKYNKSVEAVVDLQPLGAALSVRSAGGKVVVVIPADLLYWSKDAAKIFESFLNKQETAGVRECIVSGKVTENARKQIEALGFTVRENFLIEATEKVDAEVVPVPAGTQTPSSSVSEPDAKKL